MYYLILFCTVCLIITNAANVPGESEAKVVKYENINDGAGNYKFSFETSNGITRKEVGHLVNIGEENEHIVVEGSYSYIDVDGKLVTVNYKADENGYYILPEIKSIDVPRLEPNIVASLLGK